MSTATRTDWTDLADQVLAGDAIDRSQAMAVLESGDDELLAVLDAAFRVRRHHFGRAVKVHVLKNAKSGMCPEDCAFCSQSAHFARDTATAAYKLQDVDDLVAGAREAAAMGAHTYCMVTATRGPSAKDLATVCEAVRRIKATTSLRVCTSLGLLAEGQAEALAAAGVDRYNHNLETSERHFPSVCTTHAWSDRTATIRRARSAGMEGCCGGIVGLGESLADRVDLAFALRDLEVESVPVNFLNSRPGTPLAGTPEVTPQEALRALALMRLVHPASDVRAAGGREVVLRALAPLALYAANSIFTRGYLTTPGAEPSDDLRMIRDAGFEPVVVDA